MQLIMKKFTFIYKDAYSRNGWKEQTGVCKSLQELISFYGLNNGDVEWKLVKTEDC